jgi:hypothetical protein
VPALVWLRPAARAGQGVTPSVLAQLGGAGLGQVVADGVLHDGLLGAAWWALFSEDPADRHLALLSGFACLWQATANPVAP